MYSIVKDASQVISVLLTAEYNEITWKSMFFSKDLYLRWLWERCFDKRSRVLAVFNEHNFCLGYLIMTMNAVYDHQEIFIHDVFVVPEERGTQLSEDLYHGVVEAVMTSDVKRLRWASTLVPEHYWSNKMFGFKVNTVKYYVIEKDKLTEEHHADFYEDSYRHEYITNT